MQCGSNRAISGFPSENKALLLTQVLDSEKEALKNLEIDYKEKSITNFYDVYDENHNFYCSDENSIETVYSWMHVSCV